MKNSILRREINLNKDDNNKKLSFCSKFWEIEDKNHYKNIINKLNNNEIVDLIQKLSKEEAWIIHKIILEENQTTKISLKKKAIEIFDKEINIDNVIDNLIKKFLIYERKSLSNPSEINYNYYIYEEIYNKLKEYRLIRKIKQPYKREIIYYLHSKIPNKLIELSFSLRGIMFPHHLNELYDKETIDSYINKNYLKIGIFFRNKFYKIYYLNKEKISIKRNLKIEQVNKFCLNNINYIIDIIYYFKVNNIILTKKGKIRKNDIEKMIDNKEVGSSFIYFVFNMLKDLKLINVVENKVRISKKADKFINLPFSELVNFLIDNTELKSKIDILSKSKKRFFTAFDFFNLQNKSFEKMTNFDFSSSIKIKKKLEMIYKLGFLNKHRYKKLSSIYSLSNLAIANYNSNISFTKSKDKHIEGSIIVETDFSIIIYNDKISNQDKYIISLFCRKESENQNITIYKINKESIQKAIFLGFKLENFIEVLKNNSKKEINENILLSLKDYQKDFKKAEMKKVVILEAEKDIIDQIYLNKKYNKYVHKINDTILIINNANFFKETILDNNIFVYKKF